MTDTASTSVIVRCTVRCDFAGAAPMYRAFVDHELFAERTWLWPDQDLEETWQLAHRPGRYHLHYELIGTGRLVIGNWQVLAGTASINKHGHLAIHNS